MASKKEKKINVEYNTNYTTHYANVIIIQDVGSEGTLLIEFGLNKIKAANATAIPADEGAETITQQAIPTIEYNSAQILDSRAVQSLYSQLKIVLEGTSEDDDVK